VQRRATLAGLDALVYCGHQMRASPPALAAAGIEARVIAKTPHRSPTGLGCYIRAGRLFARDLAAEVEL
jgi:hypothetical protein